jgi:signal transduction histidine kinase/CheY-like chemotaxis protein/HPt (histidine-containing phosphotransfer) domain-containing protein
VYKPSFIRSVKGKIIIAAILACIALFLAWSTSKDAFTAMLNAFANVSAPNEKLRIVNDLSRGIARIDQVQRARSLNNPDRYYGFNDSKKLILKIDTLETLYRQKSPQVNRLNTLKNLLHDRDRLFVNYLKVREGLIDNKSFSAQVENLNDIVDKSSQQTDSMATTTEKKTSTTTIYPSITADKKDTRGFFTKLFGKKKAKDNDSASKPFQIVAEELHVKHDTLAKAIQDSLLQSLGQSMKHMEKIQQRKSKLFVNREAVLIHSSSNVIHQILSILKKVENEVFVQTAENNAAAKKMINRSIKRISLIMLAFVLLTVWLVYFILRDISRINKYRKELELAKDEAEYHALAKHRFLSNMSHEIRTPLQAIIGYAEMVKQQEHPQKKDIEAIYRSSGHLMQIVNEVLDYNRIISGKFSFASQNFNMLSLLDEVISIIQLQADNKSITLQTDYDYTVPAFVTGDPFRLKQILFNLLGNAIKFTQHGGIILTVKAQQVDDRLQYHFDVTDTGIGLSADDLERIFNEFEQAGDENQSRAGTGLGLPITKELIESQGGSITVNSKPGKGSSFSFDLLFAKAPQVVDPVTPVAKALSRSSRDKVWIIDDDTFILELCSRIFDNNNIPYRCFTLPHEILNTPWDTAVKYLLLDIRMPEMSGIELCGLLRAQAPPDVMIYALTAQALPGERESVLAQGFNGLMMKPFKESELIALVGGHQVAGNSMPQVNIKAIEKMTMGDPEQTAKILVRFAVDSINDIEELKTGLAAHDLEKVLLLTHRIAGRTAQAGTRELAESFRLAEMDLNREKEFTKNRIENILAIAQKLHELAIATRDYSYIEVV